MVAGIEERTSERVTVYTVRDRHGRVVAEYVRRDKADGTKQVLWRQVDGTWNLNGKPLADLPLYGSEHVGDWDADNLIVLVEGEKARDALDGAGFCSLATVTGASGTPGADALEVLRERRVCL